jgi:hypothetical protein
MGDAPSPSVGRKKDDLLLRAGILGDPRIQRGESVYDALLGSVPCSSKGENGGGSVQESSVDAVLGPNLVRKWKWVGQGQTQPLSLSFFHLPLHPAASIQTIQATHTTHPLMIYNHFSAGWLRSSNSASSWVAPSRRKERAPIKNGSSV